MQNVIGLGTFGTFGSPYGFQQQFYYAKTHFTQTLDLNPNAIEINPNSEIFAVKTELNDEIYSVCFCIYTYAREPQSGRKGSFIGSCIVFDNCTSDGITIYDCLRELHENIIGNPQNIIDSVLQVKQAKDLEVKEPNKFKDVENRIRPIRIKPRDIKQDSFLIAALDSSKNLREEVGSFFTVAVDQYANIGTLYFTTNSTVIEYVESRGLLTVVPVEQLDRSSSSKKEPVKTTKKQHYKESSPEGHQTFYETSLEEVDLSMWNRPRYTWDINEASRRTEQHNRLVQQYVELKNEHDDLIARFNELSNTRSIKNYGMSNDWVAIIGHFLTNKVGKLLIVLVSIVLVIIIYLVRTNMDSSDSIGDTINGKNQTPQATMTTSTQEQNPSPRKLYPEPNGELDANELQRLNNRLKMNMKASEVVNKVFQLNPIDIQKTYQTQREIFEETIIHLNKHCFDVDTNEPKLRCLKLERIPTYK